MAKRAAAAFSLVPAPLDIVLIDQPTGTADNPTPVTLPYACVGHVNPPPASLTIEITVNGVAGTPHGVKCVPRPDGTGSYPWQYDLTVDDCPNDDGNSTDTPPTLYAVLLTAYDSDGNVTPCGSTPTFVLLPPT
jgi:hypothetical protein